MLLINFLVRTLQCTEGLFFHSICPSKHEKVPSKVGYSGRTEETAQNGPICAETKYMVHLISEHLSRLGDATFIDDILILYFLKVCPPKNLTESFYAKKVLFTI